MLHGRAGCAAEGVRDSSVEPHSGHRCGEARRSYPQSGQSCRAMRWCRRLVTTKVRTNGNERSTAMNQYGTATSRYVGTWKKTVSWSSDIGHSASLHSKPARRRRLYGSSTRSQCGRRCVRDHDDADQPGGDAVPPSQSVSVTLSRPPLEIRLMNRRESVHMTESHRQ